MYFYVFFYLQQNGTKFNFYMSIYSFLAIAEVFLEEGDKEYEKKEVFNAIYFYTKGIQVNCKDDELNAKLYCNRATANYH